MKALRKQLSKEQFHLLNIHPSKKQNQLSDDESFYAANNNQIMEDDKNEDKIWSKYL